MVIYEIRNSMLNSCSYLFKQGESDNVILVDCGDIEPIKRFFSGSEWHLRHVLLTHAHFDHVYGLNELIGIFPDITVYTNEYGSEMLLNAKKNMSFYHEEPYVFGAPQQIITVNDREELHLEDGLLAKAVYTPGHNPSCITWLIGDALFTGDSYIPGIKTVTNLPNGDKKQSRDSLSLIHKLAEGRIVYPGHRLS